MAAPYPLLKAQGSNHSSGRDKHQKPGRQAPVVRQVPQFLPHEDRGEQAVGERGPPLLGAARPFSQLPSQRLLGCLYQLPACHEGADSAPDSAEERVGEKGPRPPPCPEDGKCGVFVPRLRAEPEDGEDEGEGGRDDVLHEVVEDPRGARDGLEGLELGEEVVPQELSVVVRGGGDGVLGRDLPGDVGMLGPVVLEEVHRPLQH
mmetsp:Transcript_11371/g.38844  ORF Transcript_11371/g.38844 Transcript_11371/m.38844 type:complete len:204 (+) Transcript_11371:1245-1856(+)